ncbi:piwi domain-containing protein [Paraphaeosphaeria sporulosa]
MPSKKHGHGFPTPANSQRSNRPDLQELNKREQDAIRDEFLTIPCVHCADISHSCLDCSNTATDYKTGPYGSLSPSKKLGADKWIDELKKRYAANKMALEKPKQDGKNVIKEKVQEQQGGNNSSQKGSTAKPTDNLQELSTPPPNQSIEGGTSGSQNASGSMKLVASYNFDHDRSEIASRRAPAAAELLSTFESLARGPSDKDLKMLHGQQLAYPARTEFAQYKSRKTLLTNHFQLMCMKPIELYEFKVPEIEGEGKRKARAIMKSIVANFPVLRNNPTLFATDYFTTIVSWVDLRTYMNNANYANTAPQGSPAQYDLLTFPDGPTTLRYERTVNVGELFAYARMDPNLPATFDIKEMISLLNIIISKCAEESAVATVPGGANKFYLKEAHAALGSGGSLCTHRGYSYAVKSGVGVVLLNVNSITSAFWRPILFHHVLTDDVTFGRMDWNIFEGVIYGLRVYITYERGDKKDPDAHKRLNSEEGRVKTITGLGLQPAYEIFTPEGGTPTTVLDHYNKTYGPNFIQHPTLQLVNLGTRDEPKWYPAEKLRILAYQKYKGLVPSNLTNAMQRIACQRPPEAKALVAIEGLKTLGWTDNQDGNQAGTQVANQTSNEVGNQAGKQIPSFVLPGCPMFYLRPALLRVDGGKLDYPTVKYGTNRTARPPHHGRWKFAGLDLHTCNAHRSFSALVLSETNLSDGLATDIYANLADWTATQYQVAAVNKAAEVQLTNLSHTAIDNGIQEKLGKNKPDMALLVLRGKNIPGYSAFKDLCDRKFGLHAICVTSPGRNGRDGDRWGNITLKMNLKAAGINHTIEKGMISALTRDTLVLGADVTHPGPGSVPGCPSIAAIVGSVDQYAGRFLGSMRLQRESRKEIIDDVAEMFRERVRDWIDEMTPSEQQYVSLPKRIIYYRDGVSESQYDQVLSEEVATFDAAFSQVVSEFYKKKRVNVDGYIPQITAIICGKRHHVRFYPPNSTEADQFSNCHPGTTVDDVVTSPHYQDFYLQSHAAIKGTARPAHYFVVKNDGNIPVSQLSQFTHELCYTYVRAPVGVSYASPAYYADRLCERGRCYLRSYFVAPKQTPIRDDFDEFKRDHERKLKAAREKDFPPPAISKRKLKARQSKDKDLVAREEVDRKKVQKVCDEYIMKKARDEFKRYNKGGNPWHSNISKTMFWM